MWVYAAVIFRGEGQPRGLEPGGSRDPGILYARGRRLLGKSKAPRGSLWFVSESFELSLSACVGRGMDRLREMSRLFSQSRRLLLSYVHSSLRYLSSSSLFYPSFLTPHTSPVCRTRSYLARSALPSSSHCPYISLSLTSRHLFFLFSPPRPPPLSIPFLFLTPNHPTLCRCTRSPLW